MDISAPLLDRIECNLCSSLVALTFLSFSFHLPYLFLLLCLLLTLSSMHQSSFFIICPTLSLPLCLLRVCLVMPANQLPHSLQLAVNARVAAGRPLHTHTHTHTLPDTLPVTSCLHSLWLAFQFQSNAPGASATTVASRWVCGKFSLCLNSRQAFASCASLWLWSSGCLALSAALPVRLSTHLSLPASATAPTPTPTPAPVPVSFYSFRFCKFS